MAQTGGEATMRLRARFNVDRLLIAFTIPSSCLGLEFAWLGRTRPYCAAGKVLRAYSGTFKCFREKRILSPVASARKKAAEEHTQSLCESASYMQPLTGSQQSSKNNPSLGFLHFFSSVLGHTVLATPSVSIII